MKAITIACPLLGLLILGSSALAQPHDHAGHGSSNVPAEPATGQEQVWAEAEVRRVDVGARKITLRHGPIPSLDMPPMSMVFQVEDPALLDGIKAGDRVRFVAQQRQGAYWATRIEHRTP